MTTPTPEEMVELAERHRDDLLTLYDAIGRNTYGGCFDAFPGWKYLELRNAGLIRSYIPAGCYAPITKLTPKGKRIAAEFRASQDNTRG